MDRKSVIVLVISFALLLSWPAIVNTIYPPTPLPPDQTNGVSTATNTLPPSPTAAPALATPAATNPVPPIRPDEPEKLLTIENDSARYIFSSHGGGIKAIELKGYPATVTRKKRRSPDDPRATLNQAAPSPVFSLIGRFDVDNDGGYSLRQHEGGVRAEKVLGNGLRLVKDFAPSTNFLLKARVRIENPAGQPAVFPAHQLVIGTATPIGHRDESIALGFEWYDGEDAHRVTESWFANRTLGCIPGRPRSQYIEGSSNVVWAAVHNQFFTMIAVPGESAPLVAGRQVMLPPPTAEQLAEDSQTMRQPFGFETALGYPETVIPAGQSIERQYDLYAGPKEYHTLSRLPKNMDLVMGFDGFFGFFAKALLLSMNGIYAFLPSYGMAIIVITIIIKLLFWPLTNASTRSMKRMAELQPQMKAIQEKYKDDPKKMNMKLMEFMKVNKVSPLGGCLPMLLQIPVFFGFYQMLQSAIELRGATFLWAYDLSQPDTIALIPGFGFPINPMPLLMGCTMLWQARLTPVSPGMDPVQQKIMKYMPLMFMVFLYNFSAGLTLYWTVQNLLTIAQMKVTKTSAPAPTVKVTPAKTTPVAAKGSASRKKN